MLPLDPTAWASLSARVDELAELSEAERAQHLASLQVQDPALAEQLSELFEDMQRMEDATFLNHGAAPSSAAVVPGEVVGAYTIERLLGEGGMGAVWLARRSDGRFDTHVAIKFLRGGLHGQAEALRFQREGQLLARLHHPHIAGLRDAGVAGDGTLPYLVIDYVEGLPIDQWCTQQALSVSAVLRLFEDVLAAVSHAHDRLILHRDLKPANILVDRTGCVKLLDFGIAKLVAEATASGGPADPNADALTRDAGMAFTPQYAAPEQAQGQEATTATDVYALGVLLFQLLSGTHPTQGQTTSTLDRLKALVETEAPRLSEVVRRLPAADAARRARALRGDIDILVARALKKNPAERYRNAAEMADDLQRHRTHRPLLARPDSAGLRLRRFVRRHWLPVSAAAAVLVATLSFGSIALLQARDAAAARGRAEDLLQYMLGDLRAQLEPLGKLELLDGVGRRALAYYGELGDSRLDATALQRRAEGLQLLGRLDIDRGRFEAAAQTLALAARSSDARLQRAPGDAQALLLHARSEGALALVAEHQGRLADALAGYDRSLALRAKALQAEPGNEDLRMQWADGREDRAGLLTLMDRRPEALQEMQQLHGEFSRQAARQPVVWARVANNRAWAADIQFNLMRYDDALASLDEQAAAQARVPNAAQDRAVQVDLARAWTRKAGLLLTLGRTEEAGAVSRQGLVLGTDLLRNEPANGSNHSYLMIQRSVHVDILLALGQREEAREMARIMAADLPGLLAANPESAEVQWRIRADVASQMARTATPADQPAALRALLWLFHDLALRPAPAGGDDESIRQALADAGLRLGDLLRLNHQAEVARSAWQAALQQNLSLPADTRPGLHEQRAMLLLRLGRLDEARERLQWIESTPWRHPDLQRLRQQLQAAAAR